MQPAIFLDRDGVIIENRKNYVRSWNDVSFLPGAVTALASINSTAHKIIIVTNQSAVGRGIITLSRAQQINQHLAEALSRNGCRIDAIFMCPHSPADQCGCRKPKPGLLLQAVESFNIDLARSIMIGDAWSDVQAGFNAGVGTNVLVKTGRGQEQLLLPRPANLGQVMIYASLADTLNDLVQFC